MTLRREVGGMSYLASTRESRFAIGIKHDFKNGVPRSLFLCGCVAYEADGHED